MNEATADQCPLAGIGYSRSVRRRSRMPGTRLLAFAALAALVSACGSTDGVTDPSGGATSTSTASASTCVSADALQQDPGRFVPAELASRLPPPPPGSHVCRIDPRTRGTVYAISRGPGGREILEYYGPALRASDCETDAIGPPGSVLSVAGDLGLPFHCPEGSGTVIAPSSGDQYVIAWGD
jgi:hypothetical protein